MDWYIKVIRQYVDFEGRARRKEYWVFVLFNIIFALIAMTLDNVLGMASDVYFYGPVYILYAIAVTLPNLAVSVRRLHDTGRSGWMMLISLIPIIGGIWLIVLFAVEGQAGENEYGLDPKDVSEFI